MHLTATFKLVVEKLSSDSQSDDILMNKGSRTWRLSGIMQTLGSHISSLNDMAVPGGLGLAQEFMRIWSLNMSDSNSTSAIRLGVTGSESSAERMCGRP